MEVKAMRKSKKISLLCLCIIGIFIALFVYFKYFEVVILPTESSGNDLTVVNDGGMPIKSITLKHYANGKNTENYRLELIIEPRYQQPQKYELPSFEDGSIKAVVECGENYVFENDYQDARDLYKNGLLLYTASDIETTVEINGSVSYDRYIYFKSGKNKTAFVQKAGVSEWSAADNAPRLKKINKAGMGYSPIYYGWRENEWVTLPAGSELSDISGI
jgi:hypothetical protein